MDLYLIYLFHNMATQEETVSWSWEDGPDSDGEEEESYDFNTGYYQAYEELKEEHAAKCEEHRILQSKYKDLLTRFEELSAKVRVFVEETATDLLEET
jgi:predicted nuclease with TOPRIM domain